MISYIIEHWRGQHSLYRSLGLNTIAVTVFLILVLSYITSWVELNHLIPDKIILVSSVLFWIIILAWQTVGSFRAATQRIERYGSVANYYVVFTITLACFMFALGSVATQYGEAVDYTQQAVDAYKPVKPTFSLTINQLKQLSLSGDIGHGATASLNKMLTEFPMSTLLILHSDGGLIAEARGLANIVKKHRLDTSVSDHCYSACTIIFIAGSNRSLSANALLGFHQYYVESKSPLPWIEPAQEQAKDLGYFQEKHVANWFMERAYSTPHDAIWTPSIDILLSAGVITTADYRVLVP